MQQQQSLQLMAAYARILLFFLAKGILAF